MSKIKSQDDFQKLIGKFTGRDTDYYPTEFGRVGETVGFARSFNLWAFLLGPLWLGARALWPVFWLVFISEIFAIVLIGIGIFGDLGSSDIARADLLTKQAAGRFEAAEKAAADGNTLADSMRRSAEAISAAAEKSRGAAVTAREKAPKYIGLGALLLSTLRLTTGLIANSLFAHRFRQWRGNQSLPHGLSRLRILAATGLMVFTYPLVVYRFAFNTSPDWLIEFPAALNLRNNLSKAIDNGIAWSADNFSLFFGSIKEAINTVLNLMETCLVVTPWPIVMVVILTLAWQISGPRVAIFSAAALAYLAILGFWEKSMATVALLGTAAFLSVVIGVPICVWCGRNSRANALVRPVLDFMQTMPAFVYLIPVIAFFGIGKPPGIIATLIFGMPPVVRLTSLGIAGVPENIREAATAYGATKRFLLLKVDLPLAMPSIMTGINQTLLMCLSMVVIASLIGAKGLGEDVLSALQYAAVGQGILSGFAILMCAMVLDRIVQGRRK